MKLGVNWNILQSQQKQHCAPPVCETASKCLEPTKEKKKKKMSSNGLPGAGRRS